MSASAPNDPCTRSCSHEVHILHNSDALTFQNLLIITGYHRRNSANIHAANCILNINGLLMLMNQYLTVNTYSTNIHLVAPSDDKSTITEEEKKAHDKLLSDIDAAYEEQGRPEYGGIYGNKKRFGIIMFCPKKELYLCIAQSYQGEKKELLVYNESYGDHNWIDATNIRLIDISDKSSDEIKAISDSNVSTICDCSYKKSTLILDVFSSSMININTRLSETINDETNHIAYTITCNNNGCVFRDRYNRNAPKPTFFQFFGIFGVRTSFINDFEKYVNIDKKKHQVQRSGGESDLTVDIICQMLDEYLLASPTGFGVPSLQSFKRLMKRKLNIECNTSKDDIDFHYSVVDSRFVLWKSEDVDTQDCDNQKQSQRSKDSTSVTLSMANSPKSQDDKKNFTCHIDAKPGFKYVVFLKYRECRCQNLIRKINVNDIGGFKIQIEKS